MPEQPADTDAETETLGDLDAATPASYEAAREELVDVVRRLEAGGTTLEESLGLWERAEQLSNLCQQWLDGARRRLDEVLEDDGDS